MDRPPRLAHLSALDGLRGIAVMGVIAFHAGYLTGGYLGVDAFFVLSGFLITSLLLVEHHGTGTVSLGRFWQRRARRLLPALGLLLVVVVGSALLWATAEQARRLRGDALATIAYVANWYAIAVDQGYWAQYESPSPLQHTWSLAIEEQFYLVWPVVVLGLVVLAARGGRARPLAPRVLALSLTGVAVSFVAMQVLYDPDQEPTRVYLGTITRSGAILLGAALAAWAARRPDDEVPAPRWLRAAGWAAVAVLAVAWTSLDGRDPLLYRGGLAVCGLCVATIVAVVRHRHGSLHQALSWRPLVAVGLVSYGLYLWHWPIFVLLDEERTGLQDPILLVVQLALTVAITLASYRWLEQPIRHGRLRGRPAATLLVGGFAATIAVAVIVPAVVIDQAPSSDDLVASLGVGSAPVPPAGRPEPSSGSDGSVPDAATTPADPVAVATQTLGRPPRVLLVGDSVAFTLAAGLVPYQDQLGVQVDSQAVIACGVARGSGKVRLPDGTEAIESPECHDWPRRWPEANDAFDADVALLVVGWPASTERDLDGAWRHPCDPVFDTWYEGEVREAVAVLRALDLPVALSNAAYWRSERAPDYSDPGVDCLNTIYARVAADTDGVELIDLLGYVCPEAPACRDEVDGIELRDDGLHFNGPSGTVVGMWAVRQALAAAQPTLAGT